MSSIKRQRRLRFIRNCLFCHDFSSSLASSGLSRKVHESPPNMIHAVQNLVRADDRGNTVITVFFTGMAVERLLGAPARMPALAGSQGLIRPVRIAYLVRLTAARLFLPRVLRVLETWAICILRLETCLQPHLRNNLICAIQGWKAKCRWPQRACRRRWVLGRH